MLTTLCLLSIFSVTLSSSLMDSSWRSSSVTWSLLSTSAVKSLVYEENKTSVITRGGREERFALWFVILWFVLQITCGKRGGLKVSVPDPGATLFLFLTETHKNNKVSSRAGIPRWLGHFYRMDEGRISKDLLYDELATGDRCRCRSSYASRAYQGRMQARQECMQNWHQVIGSLCRQQHPVEAASVTRTGKRKGCRPRQKRCKKGRETSQSLAGPQQACFFICQGCRRHSNFQDGPLQPQKRMLNNNKMQTYCQAYLFLSNRAEPLFNSQFILLL